MKAQHLPPTDVQPQAPAEAGQPAVEERGPHKSRNAGRLKQVVQEAEKHCILMAIHKHRGRVTLIAKTLGIGRQTVYKKLGLYPELRQALDGYRTEVEGETPELVANRKRAGKGKMAST